ncbi:ferritin [Oceanospirillum multiglobuliferum]|uniref:Ferritin n=1 Tax=Oceanospirillum multiglobuliferum TaxID=64969 RepID=A0A1T4QDG9_9GAMM|nr:non-heme ferritin [Oceanospirillum multiglobuliferum]OPX56507.1 ferritin [Oceanospirillum multiglobuliferum]SKA01581.1 ferritin [Oceanospirillum multiglobuliferum]
MLKKKMANRLNEQINLEFFSSNLYLQMSAWAEHKGYEGCAAFLQKHADEEMQHMKRLFTYVNETGAMAQIGTIDAPASDYQSIKDLFEKVFEHECLITQKINELAHTAFTEQDYSTFSFLQWYVAEQHEEEKLFKGILDKIEIIGEDGKGLFFIDKEIGKLVTKSAGSIMDAGNTEA